jgi:hypothetical protein
LCRSRMQVPNHMAGAIGTQSEPCHCGRVKRRLNIRIHVE